MICVPVISAKGGVGKTTLTANLAFALARMGREVLAIDLDPQNALVLHLALNQSASAGSLAQALIAHRPWRQCTQAGHGGAHVLPFGIMDDTQQTAFEARLARQPHWLADTLHEFDLHRDAIVVFDTPPGSSVYMQQVLRVADLAVVAVLADAASFATLHTATRMLDKYARSRAGFAGAYYVVNQVDASRRLNREVMRRMRQALDPHLLGSVHQAPAVSEALAAQTPLALYAPHSQAAHDVQSCAQELLLLIDEQGVAGGASLPAGTSTQSQAGVRANAR